jgi:hypothetical protein
MDTCTLEWLELELVESVPVPEPEPVLVVVPVVVVVVLLLDPLPWRRSAPHVCRPVCGPFVGGLAGCPLASCAPCGVRTEASFWTVCSTAR